MSYILVVDDEPDICALLHDILTDEGYRVVTRTSAPEALTQCARETPHLLLCDYWMPLMTGGQLCAHLAHDLRYRRVRTVMMTAFDDAVIDDPQHYDAFLQKPFDLNAVLTLVVSLLPSGGRAVA